MLFHANRRPECTPRGGFTLIELLVTMLIIAILAAAMIAALGAARETARSMHAQQLVSRLYAQIAPRYEAFRTRPLPVNPIDVMGLNLSAVGGTSGGAPDQARKRIAWFKLWGMRELMRMELPDNFSDLTFEPQILRQTGTSSGSTAYKSAVTYMYLDEVAAHARSGENLNAALARVAEANGSAECLYMIINSTVSDRDLYNVAFTDTDVGDTDNDGMPEFIDGWGNPIRFIRWPAGIESDLQPLYRFKASDKIPGTTSITYGQVYGAGQPQDPDYPGYFVTRFPVVGSADSDRWVVAAGYHDAFDPYFVDRWEPSANNSGLTPPSCTWFSPPIPTATTNWGFPERSYNLFPLIFSSGPDGDPGVAMLAPSLSNIPSNTNPYMTLTNPYVYFDEPIPGGSQTVTRQRGGPVGGGGADNIHNHRLAPNQGVQ